MPDASTDITEQGESERRFRAAFEQAGVGMSVVSLDGQWLKVNQKLCDIVRYTPVEMLKLRFQDLTHPDDLPRDLHNAAQLLSGEISTYTMEKRYIRKDGSHVWVNLTVSLVRDAAGEPEHWISIVEDISERKRVQTELIAAKELAEEANSAKDRFLATLSHELRTPLAPVLMSAASMERDASLPEKVRDELGMIRHQIELEARLIDDLLDLTRITRGKVELQLQSVDAHALLHDAVQTCCLSEINAKRLAVRIELEAMEHHVRADPARLQHVLWNLIKNAVKFTPKGGTIAIHTRNIDDEVEIIVRDSGIGIAPELLPRIFDAFEQGGRDITRKFGGLGLGLAISKALVDLHRGTLTAHSEGPDKGSTFTLTLATVAQSESLDEAGDHDGQPRGLVILLVEDHATTARVLARLLRESSHDVHIAGTMHEAIQSAGQKPFDLLISDLGLPDGSGLDLMRQLLAQKEIKGIALSGYGMDDDVQRSQDAGFGAHLTKPIDFRKLQAAINQVVGR